MKFYSIVTLLCTAHAAFAQIAQVIGGDLIEANWRTLPGGTCYSTSSAGSMPAWFSYGSGGLIMTHTPNIEMQGPVNYHREDTGNAWFCFDIQDSAASNQKPSDSLMALFVCDLDISVGALASVLSATDIHSSSGTATGTGFLGRPWCYLRETGDPAGCPFEKSIAATLVTDGYMADFDEFPRKIRIARPNPLLNFTWNSTYFYWEGKAPVFADEFCIHVDLTGASDDDAVSANGSISKSWTPTDSGQWGYTGTKMLSGAITFEDWASTEANAGFLMVIRDDECNIVEAIDCIQFENGTFSFKTELPVDDYELSIRGRHWLKKVTTISTTSSGKSGLNFSLLNGDCNGDNEINLADSGIVSAFFGEDSSNPCWHVPDCNGVMMSDADLDGDGEVTLVDSGIVSANFSEVGDSDCMD